MAKRKRITLERVSTRCERVVLPTITRWGNPVGTVCRNNGGWTYTSFPIPTTVRGPLKTKSQAVLAVVRDYKRWIG